MMLAMPRIVPAPPYGNARALGTSPPMNRPDPKVAAAAVDALTGEAVKTAADHGKRDTGFVPGVLADPTHSNETPSPWGTEQSERGCKPIPGPISSG
jgi:hypothetical protein